MDLRLGQYSAVSLTVKCHGSRAILEIRGLLGPFTQQGEKRVLHTAGREEGPSHTRERRGSYTHQGEKRVLHTAGREEGPTHSRERRGSYTQLGEKRVLHTEIGRAHV